MRSILLLLIILLFTSSASAAGPTPYQRRILAEIIAAEGAGEGLEGMRLIAETIRNRARLSRRSYYAEATRRGQYYGYTAKNRTRLFISVRRQAEQVVDDLFSGRLEEKTKGALYFINHNREKPFKWCKILTYKYKNHSFYK